MSLKDCYTPAEYEEVLRRFKTEDRINRYLKMFLDDRNFAELCRHMESADYQAAFQSVHTIKGVCMTLCMTKLLASCSALTDNLRSGTADETTPQYFESVKSDYRQTVALISRHIDGADA